MSIPPNTDTALVLAQELAKLLPIKQIYEDGLASTTKEAGDLLTDTVKTVRLALAPIQYLAVLQDRFRRFIEGSASRVPEGARVAPAPQILGPVLEAIRYEPEGSMSDEVFSKLLSRAFDRERLDQAHPAFPAIIRALSEDELLLLKNLKDRQISIPIGRSNEIIHEPPDESVFKSLIPFLSYPSQTLAYATHIESLGLINTMMAQYAGEVGEDGLSSGFWNLRLSPFGLLFVNAVLI